MSMEESPSASTADSSGKNHSTGERYTTSRMRITTPKAAPSNAPSRPLKASMNATSRPPGPAGCAARPVGRACLAAASTPCSVVASLSPWTEVPFSLATSGAKTEAAVPSAEYCGPVTASLSIPGTALMAATALTTPALSASVKPLSR